MKILWLTYDLPYPPNSGGKLRAYHLLRFLSRKFEVTLFSYFRKPEQLAGLSGLNFLSKVKTFRRRQVWDVRNLLRAGLSASPLLTVSYGDSHMLGELLEELKGGDYQLVHLEFFGVAWVLPLVKKIGKKVILGNENVEYQIYQKYAAQQRNPILKRLMEFDVWKLQRLEERFWRLADANLAVSPLDVGIMEKAGARNCYLVPNGVEIDRYRKHIKRVEEIISPRALFVGDLLYQQNDEAVRWFLTEVLPIIRESRPEFKLVVVSRSKPSWLGKLESSVDFRQDDSSEFSDFVSEADIFVSPVRIKSGTNIKLLQAMALGFPIVSTSSGVGGYNFSHQGGILVADTSKDFARAVVRLLGDYSLRCRLSNSVIEQVLPYDWSNSGRILAEIYEKI